ncbi:MAG: GGDEF domain-containing protein [Patulibacter minatonensis]
MLGSSIHVAGLLTDPDLEPIDAPDANELAEPDAHTFLGRRAQVLFRVAGAMFIGGGLNTIAGAALLDMAPDATRWQYGIGAVAVLLGAAHLLVRGRLRYAGLIGFAGIAMVSGVVATVEPLISASLFYAWPVALVAYFARPRTVAWTMGWVTVSLVAALAISAQAVDAVGLLTGVLLNMVMLGGLVTALRWREERLAEVLEAAAAIDPLTGALTRRAFLPTVEQWLRAQRPGLTLLLADVDHFKRYNDEHGHLAGDDALRRAAAALRAAVPDDAVVCRFGGEEFAIVLPSGGLTRARACADQIAEQVAAQPGGLTLSAGIAVAHRGELAVEPLVTRADQGLYAAKRAGRARVAWFAADAGDSLVVAEPIRVTRPPAFEVVLGADDRGLAA